MILTSSKGKHNSKWLSSEEIYPLTQLLTLETVQSPGLVGRFILSAAPATVGFIRQLIPSALQDDCESIKIVFHSCLKNPMDRGTWQATVQKVAKSQTRLSDWAHKQEKEKGNSQAWNTGHSFWSGVQGVHALFCTAVARRLSWAGWLKPGLPSCHYQGTWDCHALGLLG